MMEDPWEMDNILDTLEDEGPLGPQGPPGPVRPVIVQTCPR